MAVYPNGIKTWANKTDGADNILATHINEAYEEIIALETDLGAAKGIFTTLQAREDDTTLQLADITTNVKTFGAIGNGITDDTLSVQNAINYANTTNRNTVYFPSGTYLLTNSLTLYANSSLLGCANGFIYGPTASLTTLKFTNVGIAIDITNISYVGIKDITINGNNFSTIGIKGGFVTTLENVNIINCTIAGLNIFGGQTSLYTHCSFNGNTDGVTCFDSAVTTQMFNYCIFRQNTNYGINGFFNDTLFLKCIFESNVLSGTNITGLISHLKFQDCYWEQNDSALGSNGYNARINTTAIDSNYIIFDNCVFGSIITTKIVNVLNGMVKFKNCTQTGERISEQVTVEGSSDVILDDSFTYYPVSTKVKIIPKINVNNQNVLLFENTTDFINIQPLNIIFGSTDFSASFVLEPNDTQIAARGLFSSDYPNAFGLSVTGSIFDITDLNFYMQGSAAFHSTPIDLRKNTPHHIVYTKSLNTANVYHNGVLIDTFTDSNNYTGMQGFIGRYGPGGYDGANSKFYSFSYFNAALTLLQIIDIWRNGGNSNNIANKILDVSFDYHIPNLCFENISSTWLSLNGNARWLNPKSTPYFDGVNLKYYNGTIWKTITAT